MFRRRGQLVCRDSGPMVVNDKGPAVHPLGGGVLERGDAADDVQG